MKCRAHTDKKRITSSRQCCCWWYCCCQCFTAGRSGKTRTTRNAQADEWLRVVLPLGPEQVHGIIAACSRLSNRNRGSDRFDVAFEIERAMDVYGNGLSVQFVRMKTRPTRDGRAWEEKETFFIFFVSWYFFLLFLSPSLFFIHTLFLSHTLAFCVVLLIGHQFHLKPTFCRSKLWD